MTTIALRTLVAGTIACLMTACVAGEIGNVSVINRFAQKLWPPTVRGLCGFANIGSIGVVLGGLVPITKTRISDLSKIAVRALVAGNIACFMPARITGEV